MGTVTSITAERAQAIENASITGAFLSGNNLILRTRGGSEINVGAVKASSFDAWPVGAIFISAVSTPPATLLGGGTWARFGEGRMLVSQLDADAQFGTLGATGGGKTITEAMLPPHAHSIPSHTHTGTTSTNGSHTHSFTRPVATGATVQTTGGGGVVADDVYGGQTTGAAGDHNHTFTTDAGGAGNTGNGSGTNAVHLPPYIVVYMWRRTA